VPESVGGSSVHECDADAKHYCLVEAVESQALVACRRAGFRVGTG
jgi:hypothetical protein